MERGPVVGYFTPFTDVLAYSSGQYHQSEGIPFKGFQLVKIVGWDSTNIGGVAGSWIIQNTWGEDWGDAGYGTFLMNPQSDLGKFAYVAYPEATVEVPPATDSAEEVILNDSEAEVEAASTDGEKTAAQDEAEDARIKKEAEEAAEKAAAEEAKRKAEEEAAQKKKEAEEQQAKADEEAKRRAEEAKKKA